MRKFFFSVLLTALILCLCSSAWADASMYVGSGHVGGLRTTENNGIMCVPVGDAGRLLGFSSSRKGEELIVSRGNLELRIVIGSAAAWRGMSIVPLYTAPFEKDGIVWLDAQSTANLFQGTMSSGSANKIRITNSSGYMAASTSRGEVDLGQFDEPAPAVDVASVRTQDPVPQPVTPVTPVEPVEPAEPATQPEPVTPVTPAKPVTPATQPAPVTPVKPAEPVTPPKPSEPVIASAETETVTVAETTQNTAAKPQPKFESFKPDDSKTEDGENYSGTIQGIRWTTQNKPHNKIRVVITAEDGSDPQVFMDKGKLHALFSSSLENSKSIASPYSNVKAEIKSSFEGVDLIFTADGITKADKYVLDNPRRIAIDFIFPSDVNIIADSPKPANTSVQLPGQETQAKPQQPVKPSATVAPVTPSKPDPVITQEAKQPAVMTPPSTITIPTSPQAALRIHGKKTVVIDAGHGGKDPGASDNDIREKDINLSTALELEKALTARGFNVIMTRNTDVYLKLQERTDIANNVNADLFVSIHVNALPSKKSMSGFEIYIMALPTDKDAMNLAKIENREYVEGKGMDTANVDRKTEMLLHILGDMQQNNKISESTNFAASLYNAGVRSGLPMRRVAQAPFFVLRGAGMPAVLLEIGFVTNAAEAQTLNTAAYQRRIAQAMTEGIVNYLK